MTRTAWLLALLLAASLVWAYWLAHRPQSGGRPGAVTLWRIPEGDVAGVRYADEGRTVVLEPQQPVADGAAVTRQAVRSATVGSTSRSKSA